MNGNAGSLEICYCYSKGEISGSSFIGSIVGYKKDSDTNNFYNLYYLSSLKIGAINGTDEEENNITGIDNNFNTYEEFKEWIENL